MKKLLLFAVLLSLNLSQAQSGLTKISGTVFLDANANGRKDPSEKGLQDILVSNGSQLVETNKKGNYKLSATAGGCLFPILPAGYAFSKQTAWWYHQSDTSSIPKKIKDVHFGLVPVPSKKEFKALLIGDIQVGSLEELSYADQSILKELRSRTDYDLSIYLGDLVNDEPQLFPPLKQLLESLEPQAWMVYGNHDRNSDHSHQYQHLNYVADFGPTTYAFYKGNALFITLNSVEPVGKYGYKGKYPATDLQFLSELLQRTPREQLLVISQHIPLMMMENREAFLELLEGHNNILLLSGHTHTVFQNFRERESAPAIHELTAGATSGHWWTGQKDWQGVPLALMQDGTPRGYFELDFSESATGTQYQLRYKAVGLSPNEQLSLWFGAPGTEIGRTLTADNREIYANIYAGSQKTDVRFRINSGDWHPMSRTRNTDPFVARIKALQREKQLPDALSKASPYMSRRSAHLWKSLAPNNLEPGLHKLEIQVKDPYGLEHREEAWFRVE